MSFKSNIFSEVVQGLEDYDEYVRNRESDKTRRARKRKADELNEVGVVPDPSEEFLSLRNRYDKHIEGYVKSEGGVYVPNLSTDQDDLYIPDHYVTAHREIYRNSTGLKPLGPCQVDSTHHSQIVIQHGGRIVKAEPRGFGKTSRSTNEFLLGIFQGYITYGLLICSTLEKAEEIIISLTTELLENEQLALLYPKEVACFRHVEKNPRKAEMQTYDGQFTHIELRAGLIRFPIVPGCAASGAILNIRTKKNVRGIYFTDQAGPYAGKRRRPSHVLLDDIQTDEEAENEKTTAKIVRLIKKSILRAGGHSKRLSCIMTGTPIAPGDTMHHFLLKEPWQHVIYQMLESRSNREDLWFGDYAEILLDFNKNVPGSQIKAALRALEFYTQHKAEMDEGAVPNWEWCYEYEDEPQVEISAIQHAYNIMILEGMEVFESECQCNVIATAVGGDITYCSIDEITSKVNHLPRYVPAVEDRHIVTHIDLGFDYLTHVTMSSGRRFSGHIIDYGSYPSYPFRFGKGKMAHNLRKVYPEIPIPEDRLVQALKDYIDILAARKYKREDGVVLTHNLILPDERKWSPYVHKAVRSSNHRNIILTAEGVSIRAKEKGMEAKVYSVACTKHHHCVSVPTPDRTLMKLSVDVNYYKSYTHVAFSRRVTETGSLSLFVPEFNNQHVMIGEHCVAEIPSWDIDPKTDRRILVWSRVQPDNEYFDNIVGCLAGLASLGVEFDVQESTDEEEYDINDFIQLHK